MDLSEVEKAKSWKFSELKTLRLILWKVENSKVEVVISWKYESWTAQVENVKLKMQKLNHHAPWYGGDEWNDFVNILDDKMTEDDTNLRDENNALNDDSDDLC